MTIAANQPSTVDGERFTVSRTVDITAPVEKVWAAITEVEHIVKWLGDAAVLDGLTAGSGGSFTWDNYGVVPVRIEEIDPPKMIAYRWGSAGQPNLEQSTVFRFTLDPREGGTRLTVVETGFESITDPVATMEDHRGGWNHELDELVAYLESEL